MVASCFLLYIYAKRMEPLSCDGSWKDQWNRRKGQQCPCWFSFICYNTFFLESVECPVGLAWLNCGFQMTRNRYRKNCNASSALWINYQNHSWRYDIPERCCIDQYLFLHWFQCLTMKKAQRGQLQHKPNVSFRQPTPFSGKHAWLTLLYSFSNCKSC